MSSMSKSRNEALEQSVRRYKEAPSDDALADVWPLIEAWVRNLVQSRCKQWGIHAYEDLIAVGCSGAWKALQSFDVDSITQYRTYSYRRILGAVQDVFRSYHDVEQQSLDAMEDEYDVVGDVDVVEELSQREESVDEYVQWYYILNGAYPDIELLTYVYAPELFSTAKRHLFDIKRRYNDGIRKALEAGYTIAEIADICCTDVSYVWKVRQGRNTPLRNVKALYGLYANDIYAIQESKLQPMVLARRYGISNRQVSHIRNPRTMHQWYTLHEA